MSNLAQLAIILAVCIAGLILTVAGLMRTSLARSVLSRSWPIANGTVVGGNVREIEGASRPKQFIGEASYSYQVEGKYYSGYYTRGFWDEQRAWDFVDRVKGSAVMVRYKPSNPDSSVLRRKDQVSGF